MMRLCHICNIEKPEEEFSFRNKKKGIRHWQCKQCRVAIHRGHYLEHRDKYIAQAHERNIASNKAAKEFVREYLASHPCVDCGEPDPVVLEFDHVRGEKLYAISWLASSNGYALDKIRAEIEKCDVRCANCHRRRHYKDGY